MGSGGSKSEVPKFAELSKPGGLMKWIQHIQDDNIAPMATGDKKIVAAVVGKDAEGVYSNQANLVELTLADGTKVAALLKMKKDGLVADYYAPKLGMQREAHFFNYLKTIDVQWTHLKFPEIYCAVGDDKTGKSIEFMEFIADSENMYKVFGDWSHKMRPDLERPIKLGGAVTTVLELSRFVAVQCAEMHAYFWMNKEFVEKNKSWVMRSDWFEGRNLKNYVSNVGMVAQIWPAAKNGYFKGTVTHKWDPSVKALIDASFKKATPEGFKAHWLREDFQWTCCHADTHPGNWVWDPKNKNVKMIDMELFGIGSGPMDIAVWLLMRIDVKWLRKYEKEIVELYYETLIEFGAKFGTSVSRETYPIEQCWKDYAIEGAGRMSFYIPQMCGFGQHVTADMEKTLKDFIERHGVTPENVAPATF